MRPTQLILTFRCRAFGRWIRAHGFELFFLGPMIVGGALWVLSRHLDSLRAPIRQLVESHQPLGLPISPVLAFSLLLFVLQVPATFRELYDPRYGASVLDALPVPTAARFHVSMATEGMAIVPTFLVLLTVMGVLEGRFLPSLSRLPDVCWGLFSALGSLALFRIVMALSVVRWRRAVRSISAHAGIGVRVVTTLLGALALLALGLSAHYPLASFIFLPWLPAAAQIEAIVRSGFALTTMPHSPWTEPITQACYLLGLYLLARILFIRWHRSNLETARLLSHRRRVVGLPLNLRWLTTRLGARPLVAQIVRDLTLIARRFSPAVPLAAGVALTAQGAVVSLLFDDNLPLLWRQRLAVAGLSLSVLAMVALVPFLLKHQLPRFWIEKTTGVELEQIWKAKLWTATVLGSIPSILGSMILLAAPDLDPTAKGVAILQLIAATGIVTSILGLAVFEIAAQPVLGLIFGSLVALALAALIVFYPVAWWLWLALYGYVASQIAGRASRRVQLVEVAE